MTTSVGESRTRASNSRAGLRAEYAAAFQLLLDRCTLVWGAASSNQECQILGPLVFDSRTGVVSELSNGEFRATGFRGLPQSQSNDARWVQRLFTSGPQVQAMVQPPNPKSPRVPCTVRGFINEKRQYVIEVTTSAKPVVEPTAPTPTQLPDVLASQHDLWVAEMKAISAEDVETWDLQRLAHLQTLVQNARQLLKSLTPPIAP